MKVIFHQVQKRTAPSTARHVSLPAGIMPQMSTPKTLNLLPGILPRMLETKHSENETIETAIVYDKNMQLSQTTSSSVGYHFAK